MEGLGGTEIAVVQITERLSKFGWNIVVSGQVNEGTWNGVKWVHTDKLHHDYFNKFDVIIGVSYIHFALEFKEYTAKKIFWIHNTDFHPWFNGVEIEEAESLLTPKNIDGFICLTNWHREQWSQKYSLDIDRFHVIGNGIDPQSFIGHPPKIKGRFIWSSSPERGLSELLDNWPNIKSIIPEATLHVYSPGYHTATIEVWGRDGLDGVEFKGTANQQELHYAMLQSEYWPYLTSYEETYCITALEMQMARVIPIVTNVAALKETAKSGIILNDDKTKWQTLNTILKKLNFGIKQKVVNSNSEWIKKQTWSERSYDWKKLIENETR